MSTPPQPDARWPEPLDGWRHDHPEPPLAFHVPATIGDGFLLAFWTIAAQFFVLVPLQATGLLVAEPDQPPTIAALLVVVGVQVTTLFGALAYLRLRGRLSWRLLGARRPTPRHIGVGVLVGLGGYLLISVLLLIVQNIVGPLEAPDQPVVDALNVSGLHTALTILIAVVLAPIVEEFIFRGVLFQSLKMRLGLWPGMGISAISFGAVHLFDQPVYIVVIAILGFWLAGALHRTGSLLVPIVGHAVFNGVQLLLFLSLRTPPT